MTSLLDGILALIVAVALNVFLATRFRNAYPPAESRFVIRVFVMAVCIRYVGAILLNVYAGSNVAFANMYWGDSLAYDSGGYLLSQTWQGEAFVGTSAQTMISGYGFHYFVAMIYYVFGRNQLMVQFVNGIISASAGVVIYSIARELYGPGPARWALLFMSFFPQMVFWSCAMYKDPSILLCIALSIHAVLKLRRRLSAGSLLLFLSASLYLMSLRFYVFYMVAFAAIGTFLFSQRRGFLGGLVGQAVLVIAFGAALALGVRRETIDKQTEYFDLQKLQTARLDQSIQGRSAFGTELDVSTSEGVAAAIPIGLVYLLFAPFPWSISGVRQLLTLPETLIWYSMMPALFRGLLLTVRTRFRDALPILVFATTLTLAYAAFQSNVGTAYRQRTQITMFFFILIGVGIEERRAQQSRASARPRAVAVVDTRGRHY